MPDFDKIVIITRETALEGLVQRFGTAGAARFYLQHSTSEQDDFDEVEQAHEAYADALGELRRVLPARLRLQFVDRSFLPNFAFGAGDLVVTIGPDGLVVNTGKYLANQPLLAFNPDPARIDGVLVPFPIDRAAETLRHVLAGRYRTTPISMARATLNDGQTLYAVNDLFIGQRSHLSARYRLQFGQTAEDQSSSGIIVSTGAGSTGWFRSVITGAAEVMRGFYQLGEQAPLGDSYRFGWEARELRFSVREPFTSRTSSATVVFGRIGPGETLRLTSQMAQGGVIFSDGIETDNLAFGSGAIAEIGLADRALHLVTALS